MTPRQYTEDQLVEQPAIKLFEEAYQLVHDPVFLFNIAQSYRKLYDCMPSAQYYERYLAEATDADESQRGKVQRRRASTGWARPPARRGSAGRW